jgi:hypothetical protein
MDLYERLGASPTTVRAIDLEMTPDLAYRAFTCSGFHADQCKTSQRVLYCYVDNWGSMPKLLLMEQGVRHARVLARIEAPAELLRACVDNPHTTSMLRRLHAIDEPLRRWLHTNLLEADNPDCLLLCEDADPVEYLATGLPQAGQQIRDGEQVTLPDAPQMLDADQVEAEIARWDFFEARTNPNGRFVVALADRGDDLTVIDERTGLIWQRGGLDLASFRATALAIESLNRQGLAGGHDWRLPTLHEALSLLEPTQNDQGLHLHPCFSARQPFIYTTARRRPGGYWLVDFRQGRVFRGSGSSPGAFARLCRSAR